jgi:hypothetical protein
VEALTPKPTSFASHLHSPSLNLTHLQKKVKTREETCVCEIFYQWIEGVSAYMGFREKERKNGYFFFFFLPDLEGKNVSDKKTITNTAFLSPFGSFLDEPINPFFK